MKKRKRKATNAGKFPYTKTLVRHIYGIGEGTKNLLYADEINYTIKNAQDERLLTANAYMDGQDLLSEKIKLEIFDKDDIRKRREEVRSGQ